MYEIGKIYIWQNCTGPAASLNGMETTVTGSPQRMCTPGGAVVYAQRTDTVFTDQGCTLTMAALPGYLRPKSPPSGEQLVRDLFNPQHEKVAP